MKETLNEKLELFSIKEAARRLGISVRTLRRLARDKRIGVCRIGRKMMFNQWILELYVKSVYEPQQ